MATPKESPCRANRGDPYGVVTPPAGPKAMRQRSAETNMIVVEGAEA